MTVPNPADEKERRCSDRSNQLRCDTPLIALKLLGENFCKIAQIGLKILHVLDLSLVWSYFYLSVVREIALSLKVSLRLSFMKKGIRM